MRARTIPSIWRYFRKRLPGLWADADLLPDLVLKLSKRREYDKRQLARWRACFVDCGGSGRAEIAPARQHSASIIGRLDYVIQRSLPTRRDSLDYSVTSVPA